MSRERLPLTVMSIFGATAVGPPRRSPVDPDQLDQEPDIAARPRKALSRRHHVA